MNDNQRFNHGPYDREITIEMPRHGRGCPCPPCREYDEWIDRHGGESDHADDSNCKACHPELP